MGKLITIRPSKDGKSIIIGGRKYPPTEHNLEVWNDYKATKDRNKLKRLSTVVLDLL